MDIPDLRNPDPARGERSPENTVFNDLIPPMKKISEALADVEDTGESMSIAVAIEYVNALIGVADDLKRNLRLIQHEINRPVREAKKMSREQRAERREAIKAERRKERELEAAALAEKRRAAKEERRKANRLRYWSSRYPDHVASPIWSKDR